MTGNCKPSDLHAVFNDLGRAPCFAPARQDLNGVETRPTVVEQVFSLSHSAHRWGMKCWKRFTDGDAEKEFLILSARSQRGFCTLHVPSLAINVVRLKKDNYKTIAQVWKEMCITNKYLMQVKIVKKSGLMVMLARVQDWQIMCSCLVIGSVRVFKVKTVAYFKNYDFTR